MTSLLNALTLRLDFDDMPCVLLLAMGGSRAKEYMTLWAPAVGCVMPRNGLTLSGVLGCI